MSGEPVELGPELEAALEEIQEVVQAGEELERRDLREVLIPIGEWILAGDEARAEEAWRTLRAQGVRHVYVLAGGLNLWLDVFRTGEVNTVVVMRQAYSR